MQFYDSDVENDKSAEETVKPPTATLTATPQSSASSGKASRPISFLNLNLIIKKNTFTDESSTALSELLDELNQLLKFDDIF